MKTLKKVLNFLGTNDTKLVLSLDGGGVRAIAQVIFLQELERTIGKPTHEIFDFFLGTSAGSANLACLAAREMEAKDILGFWSEENLKETMSKSFWDNASFLQTKPKYDSKGKEKVLSEYFGEQKLGESKNPLGVLTYDIESRTPRILSSYATPEISVKNAVIASSAAPIYYPTYQIEDGSWLIDGGIVANNPCLIAYSEAKKLFSNSRIKVLSIGTGINRKKISGPRSAKWGALSWMRHDILGVMLESSMYHEIITDLIGNDYLRINSSLGRVNRRMDDNSKSNLERVNDMGLSWWNEFGNQTKKLLSK
tara:strand:+ start:860 stop:1789 length:930 start_codon:yes stop_codon:yes gene_type:complete